MGRAADEAAERTAEAHHFHSGIRELIWSSEQEMDIVSLSQTLKQILLTAVNKGVLVAQGRRKGPVRHDRGDVTAGGEGRGGNSDSTNAGR